MSSKPAWQSRLVKSDHHPYTAKTYAFAESVLRVEGESDACDGASQAGWRRSFVQYRASIVQV